MSRRLYYYPHAPACRKIKILLAELGLEAESILVDLDPTSQGRTPFLALSSFGRTPVLEDDHTFFVEEEAILAHISEKSPAAPLFPENPEDKAFVEMAERVYAHQLIPQVNALWIQYYFTKPIYQDRALIAEAFRKIQRVLGWANDQLADREFFGGAHFSVADASYYQPIKNLLPQFNIVLDAHPHLVEWLNRMALRPSVKSTEPEPFRKPQAKKKLEFSRKRSA